jgi:hypothetical protein
MGTGLAIFLILAAIGVMGYTIIFGSPLDNLVKYIIRNQHIHSWGLWERKTCKMFKTMAGVKVTGSDFTQVYQERKCKTCGRTEHEELSF